ncbi:MAG: homoserine O-acetyltransferase [Candidatus Diapherotrites archaeon]|nr:homoserine O-acetyltransferase [Candidatus Diapherotrites archaeon]
MSLGEIGDSIDASIAIPNIKNISFSKHLEFVLSTGKRFGPITIAYKTFGGLNNTKTNAVLVFPTLTATPQVATEKLNGSTFTGWWPEIIGSGKPIDTEKYFVICADHFGGCYGSTGPISTNPDTGKPFGTLFPSFFIRDMVNATVAFLRKIGLEKLHTVIGSSLGGLLALELLALYPNIAKNAFIIGASHKISAEYIALNHISRQAIMLDPAWNNGFYYGNSFPVRGLSIARQIGNISYLNRDLLDSKFGRETFGSRIRPFVSTVDVQYQIESYLNHQADKFCKRFDPNTYIYLSKAIDTFDLKREFGGIENAFADCKTKTNFVSISSDLLFPSRDMLELHNALEKMGKHSTYAQIESMLGHDGLFLENEKLGKIISTAIA